MNYDQVAGVIRHILTFGGGYFVAQGWADEETMLTIVSGAVAAIGVAWSVWQKYKAAG
jgi:hypothetical protein